VKHLAVQARSFRGNRPYTTPGLGDRIHTAILGWVYGQCTDEPVTLHLTDDKWKGGQFSNKPESWAEIISLFPAGRLQVCHHLVSPRSEAEWIEYLKSCGYDVEQYGYGGAGFDISRYLRVIPFLKAPPQDIDLPERFITVQWDSNAKSRTIPAHKRAEVLERYGCEAVIVGGEAKDDRLRWSLKHIAYAMSKAVHHVGADSAFFHLAQLYMPWWSIHLYTQAPSHHSLRARDNGAPVNLHL
jgi:hypothetical protein